MGIDNKHLKLSVEVGLPACYADRSAVSKLSQLVPACGLRQTPDVIIQRLWAIHLAQVQRAAAAVEPDVVMKRGAIRFGEINKRLPWRRLLVGSLLYAIALYTR